MEIPGNTEIPCMEQLELYNSFSSTYATAGHCSTAVDLRTRTGFRIENMSTSAWTFNTFGDSNHYFPTRNRWFVWRFTQVYRSQFKWFESDPWFVFALMSTQFRAVAFQYISRVTTYDSNWSMWVQSIRLIRFNFRIEFLINSIQNREIGFKIAKIMQPCMLGSLQKWIDSI